MRAVCKHFLANKLTKQNGSFGTTGRAKPPAFTRKRQQVLILAGRTSDSCKSILEVATIQILFHYTGDQTPPLAIMLFKAKIVFAYKTIEVAKEYRIEGSLLRVSVPVDSPGFVSTLLPHARDAASIRTLVRTGDTPEARQPATGRKPEYVPDIERIARPAREECPRESENKGAD